MKSKVDILSFTHSSRGRDVDILEPVLSELESKFNVIIVRKWLYDNFVYDILKYSPKMLILPNAIGCYSHFYACKFASMLGIKVVTFVSEGDYRVIGGSLDTMFFGWNKEMFLYEDLHLEWSQRNIDLFRTHESFDASKVKLSGATGFDKYSLLPLMSKQEFTKKYNINPNSKIIGLGGYTFDFMFHPEHSTGPIYFGEELVGVQNSLFELQKGYDELVKRNPDIIFIAKKHPLTDDDKYDEFATIYKYSNVICIKTQENIYDVINVCDIWLAFESTTALEAWLLGKTTLLYNPVIKEFNRSNIAWGSPIIDNVEDLLSTVEEYYSFGKIKSFVDLKDKRETIIQDIIGFSDGKNYKRAVNEIQKIFESPKKKVPFSLFFILRMIVLMIERSLKNIIYYSNIPVFTKQRESFKKVMIEKYNSKEREYYHKLYSKAIIKKDESFYE